MITKETVNYISGLARLHIDQVQAQKFARDLEVILHYVEQLNTLDVTDIKPTSHVLNMENVFRDDVIKQSLSQEEALAFSVEHLNGSYKVPKVIE
ncbi:MAG: Asp-tRNA(Asn)/Glu-tRNA(Gln) amidotransferase subunit GatC [Candidatus Omnitrophota bacterium]